MLKDLNELDKDFMLEITRDSLSRGVQARRNGIIWLTIISVVVLSIIASSVGLSSVFFVALSVFSTTYPVVYAIYSVSASFNIHLDLVTRLLVHVVATDIENDRKNK